MAQVDIERYLDLCEKANSICFFDIECTGLRADYGTMLTAVVLPYDGEADTFTVSRVGNDRKAVRELKECLEQYDIWTTYYGKGFDIPFVNTRLFRWGMPFVEKRHHLDMYYTMKSRLLTARRSLGHMLNWLEAAEDKMSVSASIWAEVNVRPDALSIMEERCLSDCVGLREIYMKYKQYIADVRR